MGTARSGSVRSRGAEEESRADHDAAPDTLRDPGQVTQHLRFPRGWGEDNQHPGRQ